MDARHFKAPYLRRTDIWKQADELRQRLLPQATLPVPVLDLAEFDLGLELVPKANLRRAGDIDALLLGDLKTIVMDHDAFMDRQAENRLRFSVAHEIGHLVLHRDTYAAGNRPSASTAFVLPDARKSCSQMLANRHILTAVSIPEEHCGCPLASGEIRRHPCFFAGGAWTMERA